MSQVQLGKPVPDFALPAHTGGEIRLSELRGKKVVIYFYPADMTPTCTQESCEFRDYNGQFKELNAEVIGISPDDLKSHNKFAAKHELPFPLLADTDQTVARLFDVWQLKKMFGKEYMGVVRSTFLIDEEGRLAKEWRKVKVKGHVQEVLESVKALQRP